MFLGTFDQLKSKSCKIKPSEDNVYSLHFRMAIIRSNSEHGPLSSFLIGSQPFNKSNTNTSLLVCSLACRFRFVVKKKITYSFPLSVSLITDDAIKCPKPCSETTRLQFWTITTSSVIKEYRQGWKTVCDLLSWLCSVAVWFNNG